MLHFWNPAPVSNVLLYKPWHSNCPNQIQQKERNAGKKSSYNRTKINNSISEIKLGDWPSDVQTVIYGATAHLQVCAHTHTPPFLCNIYSSKCQFLLLHLQKHGTPVVRGAFLLFQHVSPRDGSIWYLGSESVRYWSKFQDSISKNKP